MNEEFKCQRCGRSINKRGRCMPCNILFKHKRYYPSLTENHDYDLLHGLDPELAGTLITDHKLKQKVDKEKSNV